MYNLYLFLLIIITTLPALHSHTLSPSSPPHQEKSAIFPLLQKAERALQHGHKEAALKIYHAILRIDPHHEIARRKILQLQEENQTCDSSHEATRTQMLSLIEKQWSPPCHHTHPSSSQERVGKEQELQRADAIISQLNTIIIPQLNFEHVTLREALDYLRAQSKILSPSQKEINIFIKYPETVEEENNGTSTISLQLHNIPFYTALNYIAKEKGLKIRIDHYAISLVPLSESAENLITKEYKVASDFISLQEKEPYFSKDPSLLPPPSSKIPERYSLQEYLKLEGMSFPEGASAHYFPMYGKLIVHNTQENIDLMDRLIEASQRHAPVQVSIETKFIEINQDLLQELGFSWLLGSFAIGGNGLYGSGGGNTNSINSGAYPFPTTGMVPVGNMRSGADALMENSLNAVMEHGPHGTSDVRSAPGIFSIAGIYSNPQFQVVLRALSQKKGIDVMAAPHVTTKSGVKATVKIIDEFTYPTHYTPPQIPQSTTNTSGSGFHQPPSTITPAFPDSWTTKNLGVTLEAKPTIGPDGTTITLELHPQIIDFEGFINYGTPINSVGYTLSPSTLSLTPFSETLTTNSINQPVFNIREVTTSVTVWDGQTVVLGGLIREDTQKTNDKIPFLGDIPLAGKLFQSHATIKTKKNLLIFVTPTILNENGQASL